MPKMNRVILTIALGFRFLFGSSPLMAQNRTSEANVAEQYLQTAADQERAGLGLPPLRRDLALVDAARKHARQMVEHNSISHQYPHEPDLAARGAAAGARFSIISENVAEAPSAARIHTAWMNSEGHRHNLLDANVDSVGIAVIARGTQLFAVEDFERSVQSMTVNQQESAVARIVAATGVAIEPTDAAARNVCAGGDAPKGLHQPTFVMRYTTAEVSQIPEKLQIRLATGRYGSAIVAACPMAQGEEFSMYRIAVLLYPAR